MSYNAMLKLVGTGIVGILCFIIFPMTYFTVDQNAMTVVTRFGELIYVAEPGLHFRIPFVNSIETYRTDIQDMQPAKPANTYTVDNQEVDVQFTVFYRIPSNKVAFIFTNNRDYRQRLLSLATDRIKAQMGRVNIQSLAEKRGELRDAIRVTLQHDSEPLGMDVTDFQITDLQYTESFRKAVNEAAVQKANIEAVEYQRQQAERAALTAKIKAEGQANAVRATAIGAADARLLEATAEAKAIQLQGEATAAAIKAQADALRANSELVELRKAERWDGKLPTQMLSGIVPFMQFQAPPGK